MDECQHAFENLKAYLASTSLLSLSKLGEELYLYLVVSPHVVSLTLTREEGKVQKPVYYTNKASRSHNQRPDRSPAKEGHEQARSRWTINLVGSRI